MELTIPPLPQLLTVGTSVARTGFVHFNRRFEAYNIVFVKSGALHLTEEGLAYDMFPNHVLVLEPGQAHWGHAPCPKATELLWFHFSHTRPTRSLDCRYVNWSRALQQNHDDDERPVEHFMYLPKFAEVDLTAISPIIYEMKELWNKGAATEMLRLNTMLHEVLIKLQSGLQESGRSRSSFLAERIIAYLHQHAGVPLQYKNLEQSLHFNFDYLSRCLKKHTGLTPLQYLRTIQINKAKTLLTQTDLPISAIGEQLGMKEAGNFSRVFRQLTGMSPVEYRKTNWNRFHYPAPSREASEANNRDMTGHIPIQIP